MKLLAHLVIFGGIAMAHNAWADTGPYYVSYPGYCNVKKVWVTPNGDVYGYEASCSSGWGAPLVGSITTDGKVGVSTIVNGAPCMAVYWPDGQLRGGCSSTGTSITVVPTSTYTVRMDANGTVRRQYQVSEHEPDLKAVASLPPTDF